MGGGIPSGEALLNPGSGRSVGGLFPNGTDFAHAPVRVAVSLSTWLMEPNASNTGETDDKAGLVTAGVKTFPGYEDGSDWDGGENWIL